MTDAFLITTTVTIVLALAGYMAAYLNGLRLAQRNQRLERVNKQLGDFYGPLYGLIDSETAVFKEFRNIYRPGKHFFSDEDPPTDGDLEAWRLWMTTVFAPINNRMYELSSITVGFAYRNGNAAVPSRSMCSRCWLSSCHQKVGKRGLFREDVSFALPPSRTASVCRRFRIMRSRGSRPGCWARIGCVIEHEYDIGRTQQTKDGPVEARG